MAARQGQTPSSPSAVGPCRRRRVLSLRDSHLRWAGNAVRQRVSSGCRRAKPPSLRRSLIAMRRYGAHPFARAGCADKVMPMFMRSQRRYVLIYRILRRVYRVKPWRRNRAASPSRLYAASAHRIMTGSMMSPVEVACQHGLVRGEKCVDNAVVVGYIMLVLSRMRQHHVELSTSSRCRLIALRR